MCRTNHKNLTGFCSHQYLNCHKTHAENNEKSGVIDEFEIAQQQHKTIIPIAYPNTISELIWNYVKKNITEYPYLEGTIDFLTADCPPEKLARIIVQILDTVLSAKQ